MKITNIILEQYKHPKAVIISGGAGVGKSFLLDKLELESLPIVNPDKYVEDPESSMSGNLSAASQQVEKDVAELIDKRESFVWDTTASKPEKIRDLMRKGYKVFMVMVYTHPMISFISNFQRKRRIPKSAVFQTWRNAYQLIEEYQRMLGSNFIMFVNLHGNRYAKEIKNFNKAAENGVEAVAEYLYKYMESHGGEEKYASTFRSDFELPNPKSIQKWEEEMADIKFDREDESLTKKLKKYWYKFYQDNGTGPGDDKMKKKIETIKRNEEKSEQRKRDILENVADMITNQRFQSLIQNSTPQEIDKKVQNFLA